MNIFNIFLQHLGKVFFPLILSLCISFPIQSQNIQQSRSNAGSITGSVIDAETGEAIIGANIVIAGTAEGDATDLDGTFRIFPLAAGTYSITASYISYGKKIITDIEVKPGEVTVVNISLQPETMGLDEVTVTARAATDSDAGLLSTQRKSVAVQDGLSSEYLGKSGDGNIASAMRRITGVSLLNGKDVFVRGLGNRYSNVQLNGALVPSTNPNKKEAPVDLVSSGLIDNIVVQKTYTPDQPGEFSGGSVQITTKEFPDSKQFSLSYTTGLNSESTFGRSLSSTGSSLRFPGYGNGKRYLPSVVASSRLTPDKSADFAQSLHRDWMVQSSGKVIPSQSLSVAYSNQFNVSRLPLGLVSNFSYSYNQSARSGRIYRQIQSYNSTVDQNILSSDYVSSLGVENVSVNGMVNLFLKPGDNSKVGLKNLFANELMSSAETILGSYINYPDNTRQTVLDFDRRTIYSTSVRFETTFRQLLNSRLKANVSYSFAHRDRPDRRTTQYNETSSGSYNIYFDDGGNTHYFEQQNDDNYSAQLDYKIRPSSLFKAQMGVHALLKKRAFDVRRFEYRDYGGNYPSGLMSTPAYQALNPDLVAENRLDIVETTQTRDSYKGKQLMFAAYLSTTWNPVDRLTLELGARLEDSNQKVFIDNSRGEQNRISSVAHLDILPAVNMTYSISDKTNLRGAYSMTLARPEFREISSFRFQDFTGSQIVYGNPNLERTRIANYDFRLETYPNSGELLAVSIFHKRFTGPIELFYRFTERTEVQYKNGREAKLFGIEAEGRKNITSNFQLVANGSFIHSETVAKEEDYYRVTNQRRPMYGQSPYTINLSAFYTVPLINLSLSTSYNTFGQRIVTIGMQRHPDDEYEQPFHSVNVGVEYQAGSLTLTAEADNLLDEKVIYKQGDLITNKYRPGVSFDIGIKYTF